MSDQYSLSVLRGGTGVFFGEIHTADTTDFPDDYPALAAIDFDYDSTFLINHPAAFSDFQQSKFQLDLLFRVVDQGEGEFERMAINEFVVTLLGIRQALPVQAIWLDHAGIFVGKDDLEEYTDYFNTQEGMPPIANPHPLFFGVRFKENADSISGWSKGLTLLGKPEIYVDANNISLLDVARIVFNCGVMTGDGRVLNPGETLSMGDHFCKIESFEIEGAPALRIVPVPENNQ